MTDKNILVIGACGQIGTELTIALRKNYPTENIIAADLRDASDILQSGLFEKLDVLNADSIKSVLQKYQVSEVYLLAAILSATGERNPIAAWQLNMQSLINLLELAREGYIKKLFWPSSIAVFGADSPKQNCPQQTITEPGTMYGISKHAGENWCNYYYHKYGVDVRSLRYPGLISYLAAPGGGTTDYAIEIFYEALQYKRYTCFLKEDSLLPMMYMPDAVRATLELMEVPAENISVRTSYNLSALSFTPKEIAAEIKKHIPEFKIHYESDYRQAIADSWPQSIDDSITRRDWNWKEKYDLEAMTIDMLQHLQPKLQTLSGIVA